MLDHFAQPFRLLTANGERLRINRRFPGEAGKFLVIGHEFVQRQILLRRKFTFAPTHQAAILGNFIKPDKKRAWTFEL